MQIQSGPIFDQTQTPLPVTRCSCASVDDVVDRSPQLPGVARDSEEDHLSTYYSFCFRQFDRCFRRILLTVEIETLNPFATSEVRRPRRQAAAIFRRNSAVTDFGRRDTLIPYRLAMAITVVVVQPMSLAVLRADSPARSFLHTCL